MDNEVNDITKKMQSMNLSLENKYNYFNMFDIDHRIISLVIDEDILLNDDDIIEKVIIDNKNMYYTINKYDIDTITITYFSFNIFILNTLKQNINQSPINNIYYPSYIIFLKNPNSIDIIEKRWYNNGYLDNGNNLLENKTIEDFVEKKDVHNDYNDSNNENIYPAKITYVNDFYIKCMDSDFIEKIDYEYISWLNLINNKFFFIVEEYWLNGKRINIPDKILPFKIIKYGYFDNETGYNDFDIIIKEYFFKKTKTIYQYDYRNGFECVKLKNNYEEIMLINTQ